jgi:transmembrane sensor
MNWADIVAGHLGCDPALANLRVWGTYPLADSDQIIDAVAQTLKLDVQRFARLWVNLRPLAGNCLKYRPR